MVMKMPISTKELISDADLAHFAQKWNERSGTPPQSQGDRFDALRKEAMKIRSFWNNDTNTTSGYFSLHEIKVLSKSVDENGDESSEAIFAAMLPITIVFLQSKANEGDSEVEDGTHQKKNARTESQSAKATGATTVEAQQ